MGRRTNYSKRSKDVSDCMPVARKGTIRSLINKMLLKNRKTGMTLEQMLESAIVDYDVDLNEQSFLITIFKYKKSGYLNQETLPCKCCLRPTNFYSLSENALLSLGDTAPIPDDFMEQLKGALR